MKPTERYSRAFIEAFLDDLAKAMCPYCRDGVERFASVIGDCHIFRDGANLTSTMECQSRMMRYAANKLMEES